MKKTALVLEGGALRGMFTSGVLDTLMAHRITFDYVNGVSAGSLNGLNFLSGQLGRAALININYVNDKRYISMKNLIKEGSVFDFEFLFGELSQKIMPFDYDEFEQSDVIYEAVATNIETGEAEYFRKGECSDIYKAAEASSSMPMFANIVDIDGKKYLDGGCALSVAYQRAIDLGYEKIVVVLTRDFTYRKPRNKKVMIDAVKVKYHEYPNLIQAYKDIPSRYNKMRDEIEELEKEGRIFVIRPDEPVQVKRLEKNIDKLSDLYYDGRHVAENQLDALKEYLAE